MVLRSAVQVQEIVVLVLRSAVQVQESAVQVQGSWVQVKCSLEWLGTLQHTDGTIHQHVTQYTNVKKPTSSAGTTIRRKNSAWRYSAAGTVHSVHCRMIHQAGGVWLCDVWCTPADMPGVTALLQSGCTKELGARS